jgi:hypothetical protein
VQSVTHGAAYTTDRILPTDRGSHYFHTPKAGGKVAKGAPTQVGRALAQLGIEHIPAYSPQARGRCERVFRTLQDRLPKELALAGIGEDIEAANRFIRDVYLPAHNARFAVAPAAAGSAFVPVAEAQWRDILCVQEERVVAPDNTVAWNGRRLQIPPHPARPTSSGPGCGCTIIPTARSPSSTARAASSDGGPATSRPPTPTFEPPREPLSPGPKSLWSPWTSPSGLAHRPHRRNNKSGSIHLLPKPDSFTRLLQEKAPCHAGTWLAPVPYTSGRLGRGRLPFIEGSWSRTEVRPRESVKQNRSRNR